MIAAVAVITSVIYTMKGNTPQITSLHLPPELSPVVVNPPGRSDYQQKNLDTLSGNKDAGQIQRRDKNYFINTHIRDSLAEVPNENTRSNSEIVNTEKLKENTVLSLDQNIQSTSLQNQLPIQNVATGQKSFNVSASSTEQSLSVSTNISINSFQNNSNESSILNKTPPFLIQSQNQNVKNVYSPNLANISENFIPQVIRDSMPQSTPVSTFDCPPEYVIDGTDDEWFRTKITQRSPISDISDENLPHIVILTPVSNTERHLKMYFKNICSLDYPHQRISIVLGEDSSIDGTLDAARMHADAVRKYFERVEVLQLKSFGRSPSGQARHASFQQLSRRRNLAKSRNQLLFRGVHEEEWALWIDSDVKHVPRNIIRRLLGADRDIVAPNCLYRQDSGMTDTFDRNTWRETNESRKYLQAARPDFLMLEGYEPSRRKFLNHLKEEGDVVKIDGVGGCMLLVKADLHRSGLFFPPFIFDHHIETEGLAKIASKMDISIYGLPSVNIIHS